MQFQTLIQRVSPPLDFGEPRTFGGLVTPAQGNSLTGCTREAKLEGEGWHSKAVRESWT
jgi:hypothetical protein